MSRERLGSRLGFILLSAGCAIGLGNVYRFPIITGAYGGAIFVLIYIAFLVILGLPVMTAELSVGRASQRSIATSFDVLEKPKQKWHFMKYLGISANYLLMMAYTIISGLMLIYFVKYLTGSVTEAKTIVEISQVFENTVSSPRTVIRGTFAAIVLGFLVCSFGLQKGVEKITKVMMCILFILMLGLAVYALTLPGAAKGLGFYLVPSLENVKTAGIGKVISSAMGQAFFTLSLGIGSIAIFGSYIDKERSLTGEAITIISLDTAVALMAGLIIFPAYYTYNDVMIQGEGGAGFVFTTLSSIFNNMTGGRIIGTLFFLFMSFAAMSTVIAVFENIMSFWIEKTHLKRWQIALINVALLCVLSLPAAFSLNIWGDVTVFGKTFDVWEDFLVSNIALPFGSFIYILFCTTRYGWGWENFLAEANAGKGLKVKRWLKPFFSYVVPAIILVIFLYSLITFAW